MAMEFFWEALLLGRQRISGTPMPSKNFMPQWHILDPFNVDQVVGILNSNYHVSQ